MDFLVVSWRRFQPIYIRVILDHGRKRVRHFNVTANTAATWVKQQLREEFGATALAGRGLSFRGFGNRYQFSKIGTANAAGAQLGQ